MAGHTQQPVISIIITVIGTNPGLSTPKAGTLSTRSSLQGARPPWGLRDGPPLGLKEAETSG